MNKKVNGCLALLLILSIVCGSISMATGAVVLVGYGLVRQATTEEEIESGQLGPGSRLEISDRLSIKNDSGLSIMIDPAALRFVMGELMSFLGVTKVRVLVVLESKTDFDPSTPLVDQLRIEESDGVHIARLAIGSIELLANQSNSAQTTNHIRLELSYMIVHAISAAAVHSGLYTYSQGWEIRNKYVYLQFGLPSSNFITSVRPSGTES